MLKTSFLAIALATLMACHKKPLTLDYCQMIAADKTHVNMDKSDMVKFEADQAERAKIFKRNFDWIMQKTEREGFPGVSMKNRQADSCQYWAVTMTMLHTAQSNPELFFSKRYAKLFKSEMDKGNLEKVLLFQSSTLTAKTIDLCEELKPDIEYALKIWGLEPQIFDKATFITCR